MLPYTRASQSGVAHIGMTYGLPIIASDVGGLKEGLSKYKGSFFTQPGNEAAIEKSLVEVLLSKQCYDQPKELQWDTISKTWIELLQNFEPS